MSTSYILEQPSEFRSKPREEDIDGGGLVGWSSEVSREASTREVDRSLGVNSLRTTNSGYKWASGMVVRRREKKSSCSRKRLLTKRGKRAGREFSRCHRLSDSRPRQHCSMVSTNPRLEVGNISPKVTTREEDGRAKGAQCRKHVTYFRSVVERNLISGILVTPKVAHMNHLRFVHHHHRMW